nr:hypothetical protein [Candidatus Njordarchaeota archaeon]
MIARPAPVMILVRDQDEALYWFTEKLGLEKKTDKEFGSGARWSTVAPRNQEDLEVALQKPDVLRHTKKGAKELMKHIGSGTP